MDTIKLVDIHKMAVELLPPADIDHHESDLYIKVTPQSTALINKLENTALVSVFIDNIEHVPWYELPLLYNPYWEGKKQ